LTIEENIGECLSGQGNWGFSHSEPNIHTVKEVVVGFEKIGNLLHQKLGEQFIGRCKLEEILCNNIICKSLLHINSTRQII